MRIVGLAVFFLAGSARALVAPGAERPKIAVMPAKILTSAASELDGATFDGAMFDDAVLAAFQSVGKLWVIGPSDVDAVLGYESLKDITGCPSVNCLTKTGSALGVDNLVSVQLGRTDGRWALSLKLVALGGDEGPRVKARLVEPAIAATAEELMRALPQVARRFLAAGGLADDSAEIVRERAAALEALRQDELAGEIDPPAAPARDAAPSAAWLGLMVRSLQNHAGGALVGEVVPGGPAAATGLRPGDAIIAFNERPVRSAGELAQLVAEASPGEEALVRYVRRDREHRTTLILGRESRPGLRASHDESAAEAAFAELDLVRQLGVEATPWRSEATRAGAGREGVRVLSVERDSPGASAGLEANDVILTVGQRPVSTPAALRRALDDVRAGRTLRLAVLRDEASMILIVPRP